MFVDAGRSHLAQGGIVVCSCSLSFSLGLKPRSHLWLVCRLLLVLGASGQVIGKYPGVAWQFFRVFSCSEVQYEALRDDHCIPERGSNLYCSTSVGQHGRRACDKAGGGRNENVFSLDPCVALLYSPL